MVLGCVQKLSAVYVRSGMVLIAADSTAVLIEPWRMVQMN